MAINDPLGIHEVLPPGPSRRAAAVVPSSDDLPFVPRYLWVGQGGDVTVVMANGETVTFASVPSGVRLEVAVARVLATTTADKIVAME